jgi:glycosyltransferase involved in cell wall biosynthesis
MRLTIPGRHGMLALASLGAMSLLIASIDVAEIGRSLAAFDAWHAAVAAGFIVASQACALLRFRAALAARGHALGPGTLLNAFAIDQVSNSLSLHVNGQRLGRARILSQATVPIRPTVAVTYSERALAFATLLFLTGISAITLFFGAAIEASDQSAPPPLLTIGLAMSGVLAATLAWGQRSFANFVKNMGCYAARLWPSLPLSLVAHLLMLGAYAVLLLGFQPHAMGATTLAALVIVLFAASLPISFGGWGMRELCAAHALALVDIPASDAVAMGLGIGVLSTTLTLIPGAIALLFQLPHLRAPATRGSESALDEGTTRLAVTTCALLASTLVFFQVRVHVSGGELTVNLADPVALTGAGCAAYLAWRKRRWPDLACAGAIALVTLAIAIATLVGFVAFGLNAWAVTNRGVGWIVIVSYFAIGAAAAGMTGLAREQVLTCIVVSGASVAALQVGCMVLDWLDLLPGPLGFQVPAQGFATNANAFAVQMLVLLAATYAMRGRHLCSEQANNGVLAIAAAAIALTNARSSIAMVVIFAVFLLAVAPGKRPSRLSATLAIGVGFLGALAAPRLGSIILFFFPGVGDTGPAPELRILQDTSDSERWQAIHDGLSIWFANPILGGGLGAYVQARSDAGLPFQVIHSVPAWLLAEFGLAGTALMGAAFILVLARARGMLLRAEEARWGFVGISVIASVGTACLVHDLFYQRITWLVLGLALAARSLARPAADARLGTLHVISGLGVGGAESMLASLTVSKQAAGVQQHVVALTHGGEHAQLYRLSRLIAQVRPRTVQSWMYHADMAATFALALSGRWSSTSLVWGIRCSDMDLSRYRPGLRFVVRAAALLSWLPRAIIANSHTGARVHLALGFRPPRMVVIENGIDTTRFAPDPGGRSELRAQLGIPPDRQVAISVARVDPMKDHGLLLAAMRRSPDVTCILVGKDTDKLDLPANVIGLGLRRDVDRLLPAADIIVSSSAFGEGFSNALAEGMAAGLVPITTAVGDCAEIVGDTGIVVPPGNEDALVSALASLRGADTARGGELARARIVSMFSLKRSIDRFDDIHASLLEEGKQPSCAA